MKSLLMEAYYKGQQELLFVVPFVAKILSSCAKTNVCFCTIRSSLWTVRISSVNQILVSVLDFYTDVCLDSIDSENFSGTS